MEASCVPDPGEALWGLVEDLPLREAVPRVSLLDLLLLVSGPVGGWRFSRGECHAGWLPHEGVAAFSATRFPRHRSHLHLRDGGVSARAPSSLRLEPQAPSACGLPIARLALWERFAGLLLPVPPAACTPSSWQEWTRLALAG